jgi:hypothetical protein
VQTSYKAPRIYFGIYNEPPRLNRQQSPVLPPASGARPRCGPAAIKETDSGVQLPNHRIGFSSFSLGNKGR